MTANTNQFLYPVVEQAAQLLQVMDADSREIAIDDRVVAICAGIALSQVQLYINRPLMKQLYDEIYPDVPRVFVLRATPIASVIQVADEDLGEDLVRDTDYNVTRNRIVLLDTSTSDYTGVGTELTYNLRVVYQGGYNSSEDNNDIFNALVTQTVAIYNRKDTLGVVRAQAKGGSEIHSTDTYNPDAGKLVEMAEIILQPYVYYGPAELLGVIEDTEIISSGGSTTLTGYSVNGG